MENILTKVNPLLLDFITLKDFLSCPESQMSSKTFQSSRLLTVFLFSAQNFPTDNLSSAAILMFRRYFKISRPPDFYKTGVLKTFCEILRKAHMLECLFNKVSNLYSKILIIF